MLKEAAHVVAADQRNMLTELLAINLDEPPPMITLLPSHFGEHIGAGRVVLPQALGDVGVDTTVLLLVGDRQRETFFSARSEKFRMAGTLFAQELSSSDMRNVASASQQQACPQVCPGRDQMLRAALHRRTEPIDDGVDLGFRHDVGWRDDDMVTAVPSIVPPIG